MIQIEGIGVLVYRYDITTITPTYNAYMVPDSRVSEASPILADLMFCTFGMRAGASEPGW